MTKKSNASSGAPGNPSPDTDLVLTNDPAVTGSDTSSPPGDPAAANDQAADDPALVPVRVLVNCQFGQCNTLAMVTPDAVEIYRGALLDDGEDAVAAVTPAETSEPDEFSETQ